MQKANIINILANNNKYFEDFISRNTYHSNAIEGSTLTFEETYAILFNDNKYKINALPREIYEAINHKYAINIILEAITNKQYELTHDFIININRTINQNIQYIGGYRLYPVRIIGRDEKLPLPAELDGMMEAFITKYNALFANGADYQILAEYHIEFEHIHPFPDGNGRSGRLLIMFQMLCHNLFPAVISVENRLEYIQMVKHKDIDGLAKLLEHLELAERERALDFERMKIEEQKNQM